MGNEKGYKAWSAWFAMVYPQVTTDKMSIWETYSQTRKESWAKIETEILTGMRE